MIRRPIPVDPVKETLSTRGSVTRASPAMGPVPGTTFRTPFGSPASCPRAASSSADRGVYGDGLRTMVFPVARAGADFHTAMMNGKFHGMIPAHTPYGSFSTKVQAGAGKFVAGTGWVYSSFSAASTRYCQW